MKENPLSPHLQVYKWQLSSLLSITHRITLILNIFSIFLIAIWIFSVAIGGDFYNYLNIFISSFLGKFIVIGCSWSLLFYFLAEIRHIVWDLGYGYEIKTPIVFWLVVNMPKNIFVNQNTVANFINDNLNFSVLVIAYLLISVNIKIGINEVFEDYIHNEFYKNVAKWMISALIIVISFLAIISMLIIRL